MTNRSKWPRRGLLALALGWGMVPALSSGVSFGADLVVVHRLPATLVAQMLEAALSKCKADGFNVSAAIVDSSGVVQGVLRMDHAGPHTVDASIMKAYGAASFKRPTKILQQITKPPEGGAWGLHKVKGALFSTGGFPLKVGKEVVGGIGVGGAPRGDKDEACAQAGIEVMNKELGK